MFHITRKKNSWKLSINVRQLYKMTVLMYGCAWVIMHCRNVHLVMSSEALYFYWKGIKLVSQKMCTSWFLPQCKIEEDLWADLQGLRHFCCCLTLWSYFFIKFGRTTICNSSHHTRSLTLTLCLCVSNTLFRNPRLKGWNNNAHRL